MRVITPPSFQGRAAILIGVFEKNEGVIEFELFELEEIRNNHDMRRQRLHTRVGSETRACLAAIFCVARPPWRENPAWQHSSYKLLIHSNAFHRIPHPSPEMPHHHAVSPVFWWEVSGSLTWMAPPLFRISPVSIPIKGHKLVFKVAILTFFSQICECTHF